ncbi:hypothetical protein BDV12DRAFT_158821 [Aspergillus spectabilis]
MTVTMIMMGPRSSTSTTLSREIVPRRQSHRGPQPPMRMNKSKPAHRDPARRSSTQKEPPLNPSIPGTSFASQAPPPSPRTPTSTTTMTMTAYFIPQLQHQPQALTASFPIRT